MDTFRKFVSWILFVLSGTLSVFLFLGYMPAHNTLGTIFLILAIGSMISFVLCFKKPLLQYLLFFVTYNDGTMECWVNLANAPHEHPTPDGKTITAVSVNYFESELDLETLNAAARKTNEIVNDQSCKN